MLKKIASFLLIILANLLVLFWIEGICSFVLAARSPVTPAPEMFEIKHTHYDADLGWSHIPATTFRDVYGKGTEMTVNSQGFRNKNDFSKAVAEGRTRIICSGDSFTLGFGVTDGLPWCDQLGQINPAYETVNMGQGGYGMDQAFLWYMRDGNSLNQHIQLFAFILDDFYRMKSGDFAGYGKPYLQIDHEGNLTVKNTPVPKGFPNRSYRPPDFLKNFGWITRTSIYRLLLEGIRLFQDFQKQQQHEETVTRLRAVALKIFEQLEAEHRKRGSRLVLVFLPRKIDGLDKEVRDWQAWLKEEAAKRQIPVIDMIEEMKVVPVTTWDAFFKYLDHFSIKGNAFVAYKIHENLVRMGLVTQPR